MKKWLTIIIGVVMFGCVATIAINGAGGSKAKVEPTITPTRIPSILADFTVSLEPKVLRVGEKLVMKLGITNRSDRPINGVKIATNGEWGSFTVVNVMPKGAFEKGMIVDYLVSELVFNQNETLYVNVIAYPTKPGNYRFSFKPEALDGGLIVNDERQIYLSAETVDVIP